MHYSPWGALAAMTDVKLEWEEMNGQLGYWDPDTRVIALDPRQSRRQLRSTLDHELAHAQRGDSNIDHISPVLAVRQEIAASSMSARRLIPLDLLIAVLRFTQNETEIARELNVAEETVRFRILTLTPEEHGEVETALRDSQWVYP